MMRGSRAGAKRRSRRGAPSCGSPRRAGSSRASRAYNSMSREKLPAIGAPSGHYLVVGGVREEATHEERMGRHMTVTTGNAIYEEYIRRLPLAMPALERAAVDRAIADL